MVRSEIESSCLKENTVRMKDNFPATPLNPIEKLGVRYATMSQHGWMDDLPVLPA